MKKITIFLLSILTIGVNAQTFWTGTNYKGAFPVTDGTPSTDWTNSWSNFDPENTNYPSTTTIINSDITQNTTLSGVVLLENKVYVTNNSVLTILPGTIIRGDYSTQGTLIITKGSKIIADGTSSSPIVFTSNEDIGNRAEGDWGGLVILGNAVNNQPGGVANIEGIAPTSNTQYGGQNDQDNSGILRYVRIEFPGIPLEPNKEINGVTFGSVGSGTIVDYVQVSFSGDDSFEWFGGTVNCRHLIAFKGTDDDFDTDFGYRGKVQFGLSIRTQYLSDAAGDSNCFESDNDAQGSSNTPQTSAIFSNFTIIGPKGDGSIQLPVGEKFEKSFRIRRNSSISIFNSLVTGWEKGLSIEGLPVETNISNGNLVFANNDLVEFTTGFNLVTATTQFYSTFFNQNSNDTTKSIDQISWVDAFSNNPDFRLNNNSTVSTGADFTNPKFQGGFLTVSEISNSDVVVYPNPATDYINIKSDRNVIVSISDNLGKNLISTNDSYINLSNLSSGIYFVKVGDITKTITINK